MNQQNEVDPVLKNDRVHVHNEARWDKKQKKILLNIIKFTLSSENSGMSTAKYLIYTQSNYTKYSIILFQKILTKDVLFLHSNLGAHLGPK